MDATSQVAVAVGAAVGATLVLAGAAKLHDRRGVAPLLSALGVPDVWAAAARRAVPAVELGVGGLLLSGVTPRVGALLGTLLAAAFVAVLGIAWRRGVDQPCRCLGALDRGSPRLARARALALLLAAAVAAVATPSGGPWRGADGTQAWGIGVVAAACAALVLALLGEVGAFRAGVRAERAGRLDVSAQPRLHGEKAR